MINSACFLYLFAFVCVFFLGKKIRCKMGRVKDGEGRAGPERCKMISRSVGRAWDVLWPNSIEKYGKYPNVFWDVLGTLTFPENP